jgi:hypothetical protein
MVQEQFTWKNFAKGRWLSVPLDPIYKTLGIETDPEKRSLLSIMGHFKDILKVFSPVKLFKHKISPVARSFESAFSGTDWKGSRFTTLPELIETGRFTADNKFVKDLEGMESMTTFISLALYNLRQSIPIFTSEGLMALNGEARTISAVLRSGGLDVRDTRREPVNQQKYSKVNSEILELERNLKEAQQLRDREMIAKAREDIKEYPNYNRTKARLGSTKAQLTPVNSQMKRLKLKQDAGQTLTLLEERRLQNLRDRKQKIYDKFVGILER